MSRKPAFTSGERASSGNTVNVPRDNTRRSPAHTGGGAGMTRVRLPYETWAVNNVLRAASRAARQSIVVERFPRETARAMHVDEPPYGMRRSRGKPRAICPRCYAENGPGHYDVTTGQCVGRGCDPATKRPRGRPRKETR